jgi:putative hydrolase of the HAD superfamily
MDGWAAANPDAKGTLFELNSAGYRLGLLSNMWWAADWCRADLCKRGMADFFDAAVYTSEMGYSKPHPSVFLEISSRLGMEPRRCVMVGDRMRDDVQGAQGVGMRAVWVRNDNPYPVPVGVTPDAIIDRLSELPDMLRTLQS